MSRYLFTIRSSADKAMAMQVVNAAPPGSRVEIKGSKRSLPQNDRMWAMLTDISRQTQWHGVWLRPEDWKLIFLDALKRELRMVPNLDGTGFVNLGRSSSDLSKGEMSDLMTLIEMFAAKRGIVLHDEHYSSLGVPQANETMPARSSQAPVSGARAGSNSEVAA